MKKQAERDGGGEGPGSREKDSMKAHNEVEREGAMAEAKDISVELERTYTFPGGDTLTIKDPETLAVSESGGHRVVAKGGRGYYVAPTWLHIAWTVKSGSPVMVA